FGSKKMSIHEIRNKPNSLHCLLGASHVTSIGLHWKFMQCILSDLAFRMNPLIDLDTISFHWLIDMAISIHSKDQLALGGMSSPSLTPKSPGHKAVSGSSQQSSPQELSGGLPAHLQYPFHGGRSNSL